MSHLQVQCQLCYQGTLELYFLNVFQVACPVGIGSFVWELENQISDLGPFIFATK